MSAKIVWKNKAFEPSTLRLKGGIKLARHACLLKDIGNGYLPEVVLTYIQYKAFKKHET
jgi:hypothetical protein